MGTEVDSANQTSTAKTRTPDGFHRQTLLQLDRSFSEFQTHCRNMSRQERMDRLSDIAVVTGTYEAMREGAGNAAPCLELIDALIYAMERVAARIALDDAILERLKLLAAYEDCSHDDGLAFAVKPRYMTKLTG